MNKLAIIDLDGVIANSETRFEMATQDGKIDWKVAFNPSLLVHDTPIDGAKTAISTLVGHGYEIVYLTSRPEHMQAMTQAWLHRSSFLEAHPLQGIWEERKQPAGWVQSSIRNVLTISF